MIAWTLTADRSDYGIDHFHVCLWNFISFAFRQFVRDAHLCTFHRRVRLQNATDLATTFAHSVRKSLSKTRPPYPS
jgi:hypothetical protein